MKQKLLFTLFTFLTFVLNLHAEIVIKESVIDIDNQQVKYVCENAVNNYRYTLDTYSWSERGPQFQILIEPIDNTQSAQFTTSDLSDENYWEPLFRRVTKQMVGKEMTAQNNIKKLYIYNVAMLENQFSDYEDMNYLDLEVTGNYTISNGLFSGCTRMRTFISNVSGTLTLGSNVVNAQPSFTVKVYTQEGANTWKAYKQNTGANFTVDESEVVTDQKIQGVTSTITFNNNVQTNPLPNRSGEISEGFTDPATTLLFNGFTATATEDVTELFMDYCVIPANQSSQQYNWNHVYATNKGNGKWEYSGPAIDVLSGLQSNTTYRLEFSFNTNSFGDKEGRAHYPTNGETMSIEFTTSGSEPGPVGTKCATPTIGFTNGKLNFSCETEDVEFVAKVTCTASGEGNYNVSSIPLTTTYVVSVYAKKNGYENSDVATKEIEIGGSGSTGVRGDLNGDGVVNMPDAMFIVNKILKDKFPDEE